MQSPCHSYALPEQSVTYGAFPNMFIKRDLIGNNAGMLHIELLAGIKKPGVEKSISTMCQKYSKLSWTVSPKLTQNWLGGALLPSHRY